MTLAVFVAPMFSPAASEMIEAATSFADIRVAVIAQQPLTALAPKLAAKVIGHWQVDDVTDAAQLEWSVRALSRQHGQVVHCFGAYEQLQLPLALVRERLGVNGLPSAVARNFRDKSRMKDVLRAADIPVARHQLVAHRNDALAFVRDVGFPIVIKPPAGAGALATHRITTLTALDTLLAASPPTPDNPMLAEEFLRGTEHSLETVSIAGTPVWHSLTHYFPTPLDVIENPWIQWGVLLPRNIDDAQFDDIRTVGNGALAALGMHTGVTHCEWFRRTDGTVAISEIAARPPGAQITTMISRANNIDFVRAWVELMLFGTFTTPARQYAVGTAYLRGQGTGRVRAIEGLDTILRELGTIICDAKIPTVGQTPTGSYEGDGFIMLRHPDTTVVERALQHVISVVRIHLG